MSDNGENYGRNAYAIAVPEDSEINPAVYAVIDLADPGLLDRHYRMFTGLDGTCGRRAWLT
eukprot:7044537-Heterocapsa_arctica.AAC.1